jgi:hypothetical protein
MVPVKNPVTNPEPPRRGYPSAPYGMVLREAWASSPGRVGAQSLGYQEDREARGSLRRCEKMPRRGECRKIIPDFPKKYEEVVGHIQAEADSFTPSQGGLKVLSLPTSQASSD